MYIVEYRGKQIKCANVLFKLEEGLTLVQDMDGGPIVYKLKHPKLGCVYSMEGEERLWHVIMTHIESIQRFWKQFPDDENLYKNVWENKIPVVKSAYNSIITWDDLVSEKVWDFMTACELYIQSIESLIYCPQDDLQATWVEGYFSDLLRFKEVLCTQ